VPGELYPRAGFIVTNPARPTERVVAFYNQRGTAKQGSKDSKGRRCHAARLPRTPSAFSSMPSLITSATSCGRGNAQGDGTLSLTMLREADTWSHVLSRRTIGASVRGIRLRRSPAVTAEPKR